MSIKHELQNIISGNGSVRNGDTIQSIASFLRGKKESVSDTEKTKFSKVEETKILIDHIEANNLWFQSIDNSKYIGEGAEQKIYESADPKFVLKRNDGVFYEFWLDYLNNLLLHNYFFPHLAYELVGFSLDGETFYAVVKQPFVKISEKTNLEHVKEFMETNGFVNKKNNDYYHPDLGIILEDLHDENVLSSKGVLQFIDTVFYLTDKFYEPE